MAPVQACDRVAYEIRPDSSEASANANRKLDHVRLQVGRPIAGCGGGDHG